MATAIEAGREKYRAKVSMMQRNWEAFQRALTTADVYVTGLKNAGLTAVATSISDAWLTGVRAASALDKYKSKVTSATADVWYRAYTSKMETGTKVRG